MNLPNKLTLLRVILVPVFVFFLLAKPSATGYLCSFIVFILASLTDYFDGKIARNQNQITNFGKFLDPLADKILVMSAFLCFIELGFVSAVPIIIVLFREFLVTSVRLAAIGSGKVISANKWGKIKTFFQMDAILLILLWKFVEETGFGPKASITSFTVSLLVWICALLNIISGYIYLKGNMNFIKTSN